MTTTPDPKVIDLIAKLKNMTTAKGATEAEAATALQKMQKLLFEHNLSMSDVNVNRDEMSAGGIGEQYESTFERTNTKPGSGFKQRSSHLPPYEREWRVRLATAIARYNFCSTMVGGGWSAVFFVGKPENIAAVKEIWLYACDQVDRLSYEALKARRRNIAQRASEGYESGKTWRNAWLFGCVDRVATRLYESWQELRRQSEASTALVVYNDKAISEYIAERTKNGKRAKSHAASGAGYSHGYAAGDRVNLGRNPSRLEGN